VDLQTADADEILDGGVGKRLGVVDAPSETGGPASRIPLAVVTGERPGPTAWVNASLHGDEYLGPATIVALLRSLEPGAVRGRLVLSPTLNPGALRAMQREDPAAPADLNRVWSPEPARTPIAPVVSWALGELLARSDLVIDLHSGGNRFLQAPFSVYARTGGAVETESAALAKACGLPRIWAHRGSILDAALITAAARRGKPAALLEMGGEGKSEPAWIEEMAAALRGALAHAQIIAGQPRFLESYRVFHDLTVVRNREEGLWVRAAEPEADVPAGSVLGHVLDLLGREVEVVSSPVDATVVGICTYGFVPPGDYVAELAHTFHEEGPPG